MTIAALLTILVWLVLILLFGGIVIWVASEVAPATAPLIRKVVVAICGLIALLLMLGVLTGTVAPMHFVVR
jgi:hypothetical protein